jgi:hypothetical protein
MYFWCGAASQSNKKPSFFSSFICSIAPFHHFILLLNHYGRLLSISRCFFTKWNIPLVSVCCSLPRIWLSISGFLKCFNNIETKHISRNSFNDHIGRKYSVFRLVFFCLCKSIISTLNFKVDLIKFYSTVLAILRIFKSIRMNDNAYAIKIFLSWKLKETEHKN